METEPTADYWCYDKDGFDRRVRDVSAKELKKLKKKYQTVTLATRDYDPIDWAQPGYFGSW